MYVIPPLSPPPLSLDYAKSVMFNIYILTTGYIYIMQDIVSPVG